eukprot:TRINITY_DN11001_c0_g1_i1.p1 TRINITY_DN11001_c0_g1~~TRINITY_DN11001_c0_g1_i1.p1  ORF type:complete len:972 (+),score=420.53 TRINITY_DN11001_c0_g1_i1:59-2917(+)
MTELKPTKPISDTTEYLHLSLSNNLQVLLVSDPTTDKSGAAMDVGVGHLCDPEELPGLAHFLEHMLFMGTEKYPSENSYSAFLAEHGGSSNAYTSSENTNYYFDVIPEHLKGALDRFAQFFISPLFNADSTDREIEAVNNENAKNLQEDNWRQMQLLRHLADERHPFHKFGTGNADTLKAIPKEKGINVRDALLTFHEEHYFVSSFRLTVLGKESLAELKQMVVELFGQVTSKSNPAHQPSFSEYPTEIKPYSSSNLGKIVRIVPVKDLKILHIYSSIPTQVANYREKAAGYLSHLIGHESEGSILSLLKKKGWANALSAGPYSEQRDLEFFKTSVEMTEEGLKNWEGVVAIVFGYIRMLESQGPQEWIYEEVRKMTQIDFDYMNKISPFQYVSFLASNMRHYTPQEILTGPYLAKKYDASLIKELMANMIPQNSLIFVTSKLFESEATETERWYGTKYSIQEIAQDRAEAWSKKENQEGLHTPDKNSFIPDHLAMADLDKTQTVPVCIVDGELSQTWYKPDHQFDLPRSTVDIRFLTPLAYSSPLDNILSHLACLLFDHSLKEYAYKAEISGLKYGFTPERCGIKLRLVGFSEKLPLLLETVIKRIKELEVAEDVFGMIKEKLTLDYANYFLGQPYSLAMNDAYQCLMVPFWHTKEKASALTDVTAADVGVFIKKLFSKVKIESLVCGNFTRAEAETISKTVESQLSPKALLEVEKPATRVVNIPAGKHFVFRVKNENPNNKNSSIFLFYQNGPESIETTSKLDVLAQIIREPAFDQLRTKEQLGYIVWAGSANLDGVEGVRVIIQSSVYSAGHLHERSVAFLSQFRQKLQEMSEEEFEKHKKAVVAEKEEKDLKISAESQKLWAEISCHQYLFERRQLEAQKVKTLTKADVIDNFDQLFDLDKTRGTARSLCVYSEAVGQESNKIEGVETEEITSLAKFRASMPLFACMS